MTIYGYARHGRGLNQGQIQTLESAGCERVFYDHGRVGDDRPGWQALVQTVTRGDVVRVVSWSRLTRQRDTAVFMSDALRELGVTVEEIGEYPAPTVRVHPTEE